MSATFPNGFPHAIRLVRIDFDSLENTEERARSCEDFGVFLGDEQRNAKTKIDEFLAGFDVRLYLGWDGEVYPKFELEEVKVR
jgi:hypothetical protein